MLIVLSSAKASTATQAPLAAKATNPATNAPRTHLALWPSVVTSSTGTTAFLPSAVRRRQYKEVNVPASTHDPRKVQAAPTIVRSSSSTPNEMASDTAPDPIIPSTTDVQTVPSSDARTPSADETRITA